MTDDIRVPDGHYAAPNMAITVVPNRNAIMLSLAYGIAVAENAEVVAIGRMGATTLFIQIAAQDFIASFDGMQRHAVEGLGTQSSA